MKAIWILGGLAGLYLLLNRQQALAALQSGSVNVGFNSSDAPQGIGAPAYQEQNQAAALGQQASSIPVIGPVVSAITNLFAKLNHPYGKCAPEAISSYDFLACWNHPIPDKQIPYWKGQPTTKQPGTMGWDFAFCRGAKGGTHSVTIPEGGCNTGGTFGPNEDPNVPCNCSTNPCVCAPAGAVMGMPDGTFVDANGRNLGPAVAQVRKVSGLIGSFLG